MKRKRNRLIVVVSVAALILAVGAYAYYKRQAERPPIYAPYKIEFQAREGPTQPHFGRNLPKKNWEIRAEEH